MRIQFEFAIQNNQIVLRLLFLYILSLALSCSSTKYFNQESIIYKDNVANMVTVNQSQIPVNAIQSLEKPDMILPIEGYFETGQSEKGGKSEFPVAQQIVSNYLGSDNKEPGGHCLTVSKTRFLNAYKQVHGHSVYQDLPKDMASKYYTPAQVFDNLYASTSGTHKGWLTLPRKFRGRGNAGAIAYAGMGDLLNGKKIWSGKLKPGAPMQVWRDKKDFKEVVNGISDPEIDPFGHSFIFIHYVRNSEDEIIGIKIADQGYQSSRTLVPSDYAIWWGVNLKI